MGEILIELEQPEQTETTDTKDAETCACPLAADDGSILGKFANVNELCKAYENLQGEFTRKSQLLAQMQQGNACEAVKQTPVVDDAPIKRDETIKNEIIKEYLTSIAVNKTAPAVITTNNDFAFGVTPTRRSIREVEKIAENFFKTKEETT